jgi:excisionase family DNA binding protein
MTDDRLSIPNNDPEVLTADEAAALLRVSRKAIYAAANRGEIPGAFRLGRSIRFSRAALVAWMRQGRVVPNGKGQR